MPVDLDGNPRVVDIPTVPDCPQLGGKCFIPAVDMGAYEFPGPLSPIIIP